MTSPSGSLPATPTYVGAAGADNTSTSSSNPNDVWGLGALYGQPVLLGINVRSPRIGLDQSKDPGDYGGRTSATAGQYGQTQDLMQQITDMWAAQGAERVKDPNSLTTFEQMQQALWTAGFYGQTAYKNVHLGQLTSQTKDALIAALDSYEQTRKGNVPITFSEFLQQNTAGSNGSGSNATAQQPQVQLTDPKEIRAAAQAAAQQALGKSLTDKQLDAFVSQFQGSQSSAQLSTASSVSVPELTSEANAYAQQVDPTDYQSYQADSYQNALVNMFLPSGAVSRPNITPTPTA